VPVRSSWIHAIRWSWLSEGLVLAGRCWTVTVVFSRDFAATMKKVLMCDRVVVPAESHSSM